MRQLICAVCCAVGAVLVPTFSPAQNLPYDVYDGRPEPPMETSIPVAAKPASAEQQPAAPIRAVQHKIPVVQRTKIIHHIAKVAPGPVAVPSPEVLVMLLRSTLVAVNQANFTENYSVLLGMMTPARTDPSERKPVGQGVCRPASANLDLSPALVLTPRLVTAPSLTPEHVLRLNGFFPSGPLQIDFAIDYRAVDGYWLIDGLSVKLQATATRSDADLGAAAKAAQIVNR